MTLTATPQGPVAIDSSLTALMRTTGYVSSVNGKQGAVFLDLTGGGTETVGGIAPDEFGDVRLFTPPKSGSYYVGGARRTHTFSEAWGGEGYTLADDFTTAVQALANWMSTVKHGGMIEADGQYRLTELVLPSGVILKGGEGKTSSTYQSQILPAVAAANGSWLIRIADNARGAGVIGFNINGGVTGSGSPNIGGIKFNHTTASNWCKIVGVSITGTSLGCLDVDGGQHSIRDVIAQNFWQFRQAASEAGLWDNPAAAIWVKGADHELQFLQGNGGDLATVYDPTNLNRCGILLDATTSWMLSSNGEYADIGIRVRGIYNHLTSPRGDSNAGVGIVIDSVGVANHLTDAMVLSNSLAGDGLYDGMSVFAPGCTVKGVTVGNKFGVSARMRYGVSVNVAFASVDAQQQLPTEVEGVKGAYSAVSLDLFRDSAGSLTLGPASSGAGSAQQRPPSRWAKGRTWTDTGNGTLARSDGSAWRDSFGEVVSNVLPSDVAVSLAAGGWGAVATTCTPSWVRGTAFGRPSCISLVPTAGGVTAAAATVAATSSATVAAGRQYTPLVHALGPTGTTVVVGVYWYDAGAALISSSLSSALAVSTTDTLALGAAVTAPAGAVTAIMRLSFARSGLSTSDVFQHCKAALIPGTGATEYVAP